MTYGEITCPARAQRKQGWQAPTFLYIVTVLAACVAFLRGTLVSVENPSSRYLWPLALKIAAALGLKKVWEQLVDCQFHACVWGSTRDKRTTFRASANLCESLIAGCDGQHEHESGAPRWDEQGASFPTSEEAECLPKLCAAYAANLWNRLLEFGARAEPCHLHAKASVNARALRQFTSKRVPPLMGEYWFIGSPETLDLFPDRCKLVKYLTGKEGMCFQQPASKEQANELEKENASSPATCIAKTSAQGQDRVGVYRASSGHPCIFGRPAPVAVCYTGHGSACQNGGGSPELGSACSHIP